MHITTNRILSLTVGVAFAAAALSGCTSSSTPTARSTPQAGTEDQARTQWESDLRACIEKQGFDLPEDGQIDFGSRQGEYELASQQCEDEVGPVPGAASELTPEDEAGRAESWAAADKCWRDAGFSEGAGDTEDAVIEPEGSPEDVSERCFAASDAAWEAAHDR